jgi:hypothetical protein
MAEGKRWRLGARAGVLAGLVGAISILPGGAAIAESGGANGNASCLGIVLSVEAPSAPRFIGSQVADLATSGPGGLAAVIGELAHFHGGSYETCEG